MIQNVNSAAQWKNDPPLTWLASYVGHGGDTYGFMSDNGYFPKLKASISIIVNEDWNGQYPSLVTCKAVEIVAKHLEIRAPLLKCGEARAPKYRCVTEVHGRPTKPSCEFTYDPHGETKSECDASCGKSAVEFLMQN